MRPHRRPLRSVVAVVIATLCTALFTALGQNPAQAAACPPNLSYMRNGVAGLEAHVLTDCGTRDQLVPIPEGFGVHDVALSPDSTTVAVNLGDTLSTTWNEVWLISLATGEATKLTELGGFKGQPVWEPHGRYLSFVWYDRIYPAPRVVTVDPSNTISDLPRPPDDVQAQGSPCYAPVGGRIGYPAQRGTTEVGIAVSDGRQGSYQFVPLDSTPTDCSWTPDGNYLVYPDRSLETGDTEIYVSDLAGHRRRLTSNQLTEYHPVVANDWTVYYERLDLADETSHVYSLNLGTLAVERITSGAGESRPTLADTSPVTGPPPGFPPAGWETPGPGPSPTPTPTPAPANRIGAWGDSFISGEGAPGYQAGTDQPDNRCHRSTQAFPMLIAQKLGKPLDFRACSGAIVQDFRKPFAENHDGKNPAEKAQIQTVNKKQSIGFVTITGNNVAFGEIMEYCATRAITARTCEYRYGDFVKRRLNEISKSPTLPKLYRDIRTRMAPGAKLYVIGYPRFFPKNPPARCSTGLTLPPFSVFVRSDMTWINNQIARLNAINKRTAKEAGATFIDIYDVFDGHEICNTAKQKPWMNLVDLGVKSQSFHPNVAGHKAEADWILSRL
jgi:Tol biopolymer transport system component